VSLDLDEAILGWNTTSIIKDTLLAVTTDEFVEGPRCEPTAQTQPGEGVPLSDVLDERHAGRVYRDAPVELEVLQRLARSALEQDRRIFADAEVSLGVRGVVWRSDCEAGVYRFGSGPVECLGPIPAPDAGHRFLLQGEFAEAAAVFLITADLAASLHTNGDHGYRRLISRGAAAAHHLWLDAGSIGLECCAFAGVLGDEDLGIVSPSAFTDRIIMAAAVGHPPSP